MKNFVFISPNFPEKYWQFCDELQKNGVRVLGIGDAPKDGLSKELKGSLTEYYQVGNIGDYDQMYRAVGYFAWKYGHIDWIESNNEFWLEVDARLRTDFNVTTGVQLDGIEAFKEKSEMKKRYAAGGIRTARQLKASEGLVAAKDFSRDAGFPLFAKPDVGVGAGGAHKIESLEALEHFFAITPDVGQYVIEEFVTGDICTYDAVINSKGQPLVESMCVCPPSIADIVNQRLDSTYFVEQHMSENLRFWGRRTVEAFGVKSRFVHLEFFRLNKAHRGLGEAGDFVALEVNMRPGGGFTPDMINFAHNISVYKIWADMIAFDRSTLSEYAEKFYCIYVGRRDGKPHKNGHNDILSRYRANITMSDRMPAVLATAMGDQMYIAKFSQKHDMEEFLQYVIA